MIFVALDSVADEFKINVINYIEKNELQKETGISCISDIKVSIVSGEFKGIFKEFEDKLQDFSSQNIVKFIDR